jgi:autotransporter-associated beta strand protein
MKTTFLAACACLCACLPPLPLAANEYIWDNQNGNGLWNDPVNWGISGNQGYNTAPTTADSAIFLRNFSPSGTVRLSADGFANRIRQEFSRNYRTITIDAGQTVDRTLTLGGTASGLIDGSNAGVDFTLDGTPNVNGARLRLKLDGSGTGTRTSLNKAVTLRVSCDVSGAGGFILNGGEDGAGRLVLSGINTYTGPTTVNAGVLLVNGSTAAASAVTVNSGGILGGIGTIGGPVTVAAGGLVSPGASSQAPVIGTLTVSNNLTLAGDLLIEVNKSLAPSNDMVTVSGMLTNTSAGTLQLLNMGPALTAGDRFKVFNKPLLNGAALRVLSGGTEVWTNKLAVDGSIEVLSAANTPITGNPTTVFTWKGAVTTDQPWKAPMQTAANWVENQAPAPLSSNVFVFQGDILVPYNWPYVDTNYGTSILIFSNNTVLNSIKVLAGSNHVMNLGSYVRQDTAQPCYFGITGPVPVVVGGVTYTVNNAYFTNALGDASCGSQTDFQCTGGRLDIYGVLKDGAGTSSRLIKSGNYTLNLTGDLVLGNDANKYTGGTIVNAGPIKMAKMAGVPCIPGDVTVNGTGALQMNVVGGEQIADTAIVTLNDSASLSLAGQPETVQAVQSSSASASISLGTGGTLTVGPSANVTYSAGVGECDFIGSVTGSGTVVKNGTGTFGMLGVNSANSVVVNSGTLKLNGNSGSGPVTVNPGGTLQALGTIIGPASVTDGGTLLGQGPLAGPVTIAGGGTIGAGVGVGAMTLSAGLNLSAGGSGPTNVWELAALKDNATGQAGADFDQLVLTGGTLSLSPQATLEIRFIGAATAPDVSNPFWQTAHAWTIVSLSGGSNPGSANFHVLKNASYAAGEFTTSVDGNGGIVLVFQPVTIVVPWGDNSLGQSNSLPGMVNLIAVAAGSYHSLALRSDGTVLAWGDDSDGQCDVPGGLTDALAIAAGGYHSLAIRANGTVLAWGGNDYGQTAVPTNLASVVGISAGTWHSLALRRDGSVMSWGDNGFGQCNVPAGLSNAVAVAAGGNHSLALLVNGTVVGWGENTDPQGFFAGQATPPWGLTNVVGLGAGGYHSVAVLRDGSVVAWGDDSAGQCEVPPDLNYVVAVAGGVAHSVALRSNGTVEAWGANGSGQSSVPLPLTSGAKQAVAIAAGAGHSVALLAGGLPVPKLWNSGKQGTGFSALAQTLNRKSYALECKSSVSATSWTAVSTNAGNGALTVLRDASTAAPARFYRMRQW